MLLLLPLYVLCVPQLFGLFKSNQSTRQILTSQQIRFKYVKVIYRLNNELESVVLIVNYSSDALFFHGTTNRTR